MTQYFLSSYIVTIVGIIAAFLWGNHIQSGFGIQAAFIALVLAILETSLSFDNAVVNAMKLEKMPKIWERRFLTWGILIAVFGMRFLFPILVVSIFAQISMGEVLKIALSDADKYAFYLTQTHAPIVTFGGMFLIMLFFNYFFNHEKDIHWIQMIEKPLSKLDHFRGLQVVLSLIMLIITANFIPFESKTSVLTAGIFGVITYLTIDGFTKFLEKHEHIRESKCCENPLKCTGLISFIYLELIDASFSLDGVLGAFALSKDIVIIAIGLGIGAMFVRSLTVMLVEKKTLKQLRYLEHGAHWAIGALACLMLISTVKEIPEVITGLIGLIFIVSALISSIKYNIKMNKLIAGKGENNA